MRGGKVGSQYDGSTEGKRGACGQVYRQTLRWPLAIFKEMTMWVCIHPEYRPWH